MDLLQKGDDVLVTCGDRAVDGRIVLISSNQVSVLVSFDAMFGGHCGTMPAMLHDAARGAYRSIIDQTEIILQKKKGR